MHHLIANWIYIVAGLAFAAFLGCLIGHSIRERRHAAQLKDTRDYWQHRYDDMKREHENMAKGVQIWKKDAEAYKRTIEQLEDVLCAESKELQSAKDFIKSLREQNRSLEQSVDVQTRAKNEFRTDADAYRLQAQEFEELLDAATDVNGPFAKRMQTRGVRKANKLNRARLAKIVEEYERKCQALAASGSAYEHACHNHYNELQLHREALRVTMKDKIGLVGVRRAFHKAFIANIAQLRIQQVTK